MTAAALVPAPLLYGEGLQAVSAGRPARLQLRTEDGTCTRLDLEGWCGTQVPGDDGLLERCTGPTLDIGCGPGRLTAALAGKGVTVLGVDVAPTAVSLTVGRGATALRRSVFERLPGEGRWQHLLLADGNLGIGGDPIGLLRRCAELLRPGGDVLVELDPPATTRTARVRLESGRRHSGWFEWAHVGADAIEAVAGQAGSVVRETWREAQRWFAALVPG